MLQSRGDALDISCTHVYPPHSGTGGGELLRPCWWIADLERRTHILNCDIFQTNRFSFLSCVLRWSSPIQAICHVRLSDQGCFSDSGLKRPNQWLLLWVGNVFKCTKHFVHYSCSSFQSQHIYNCIIFGWSYIIWLIQWPWFWWASGEFSFNCFEMAITLKYTCHWFSAGKLLFVW